MKRKGFTLVELIAVIVIIGVLAIILIPVISNSSKNAKQKMLETKVETSSQALVVWAQNNRSCFLNDSSSNNECLLGLNKDCDKDEINNYIKCETTYGKMANFGVIKYDDNTMVVNPVNNSSMNDDILNLYYNLNTKIFCISDDCITNNKPSNNIVFP